MSTPKFATRLRTLLACGLFLTGLAAPVVVAAAAACPGDCGGDGVVTVDDLLRGVNVALGIVPLTACRAFDTNNDNEVTVDDILVAISALLNGCPQTPTPTATASRRPTVTPTPTINHPPDVPSRSIYRAYPGFEMRIAIAAVDPDGDALRYAAEGLPDGATLDRRTGVFTWTPRDDQLGPFAVSFTCVDSGRPPASAAGVLTIKVSPPDMCTAPVCDAATGCSVTLPEVTELCCNAQPTVRVPEPDPGCPEGRVLFLGRNNDGFGRLQDCDRLRVINFAQAGAVVRFHIQARCVNSNVPVIVRATMRTKDRMLFVNLGQQVQLADEPGGFAARYFVTFPVFGARPYFDLEGAEANLNVTLTDADDNVVAENLRLELTFTPIPELPESDPSPTPTSTPTPEPTPPPL